MKASGVILALLAISFGLFKVCQSDFCLETRGDVAGSADWPTYSGTLDGHRYSELTQINDKNVSSLRVAWTYQSQEDGGMETTPLVRDGVMYITEFNSRVVALDASTGKMLWTYKKDIPDDAIGCCGKVNRGVGLYGDLVFFTSFDAHLIALNATTGTVRWDVELADYKLGYSSTSAPLVFKDKVITGIAGSSFGMNGGFLDAYDVHSGRRLWRFKTIPDKGKPGDETWPKLGNRGGATPWMIGSADEKSDTIFWGTSAPSPVFNGDNRAGDNLYANCILAIHATTGKLLWHFQQTPHDTRDYDAAQVPILVDVERDGKTRKLLLTASRNGFYYVLDRETGRFLRGTPFAKQTWAKGLLDNGRPDRYPEQEPSDNGKVIYPHMGGATNWNPPTYSPRTKLFYTVARDIGGVFYKTKDKEKWDPGAYNESGRSTLIRSEGADDSSIKAIEAETGKAVWSFPSGKALAYLLSTAGRLVFVASKGSLFALSDTDGRLLWRFNGGRGSKAAPMTYAHSDKQYVAVAILKTLYVFELGNSR